MQTRIRIKRPPSVAIPSLKLDRDGFVVRRCRHRVDAAAPRHAAAAPNGDAAAAADAIETEFEIRLERAEKTPAMN